MERRRSTIGGRLGQRTLHQPLWPTRPPTHLRLTVGRSRRGSGATVDPHTQGRAGTHVWRTQPGGRKSNRRQSGRLATNRLWTKRRGLANWGRDGAGARPTPWEGGWRLSSPRSTGRGAAPGAPTVRPARGQAGGTCFAETPRTAPNRPPVRRSPFRALAPLPSPCVPPRGRRRARNRGGSRARLVGRVGFADMWGKGGGVEGKGFGCRELGGWGRRVGRGLGTPGRGCVRGVREKRRTRGTDGVGVSVTEWGRDKNRGVGTARRGRVRTRARGPLGPAAAAAGPTHPPTHTPFAHSPRPLWPHHSTPPLGPDLSSHPSASAGRPHATERPSYLPGVLKSHAQTDREPDSRRDRRAGSGDPSGVGHGGRAHRQLQKQTQGTGVRTHTTVSPPTNPRQEDTSTNPQPRPPPTVVSGRVMEKG